MAYLIILLGSTGYGVLLGQPHHPVPFETLLLEGFPVEEPLIGIIFDDA